MKELLCSKAFLVNNQIYLLLKTERKILNTKALSFLYKQRTPGLFSLKKKTKKSHSFVLTIKSGP